MPIERKPFLYILYKRSSRDIYDVSFSMVKHGGYVPLIIANRLWQGSVWRLSSLVSQAYPLGVLYVLDVYSMEGTHKSNFKFLINFINFYRQKNRLHFLLIIMKEKCKQIKIQKKKTYFVEQHCGLHICTYPYQIVLMCQKILSTKYSILSRSGMLSVSYVVGTVNR